MDKIPARIEKGRVVRIQNVPGEDGKGFKLRYVIVLDQVKDEIFGVVSTTQDDGRDDKVRLPYGPTARTGLPDKSVAVCRWRVRAHRESIHDLKGYIPTTTLDAIHAKLVKLREVL